MSLRLRLTVWVVIVFSVMQWSSAGVFWLYKQAAMDSLFDREVQLRALAITDRISPVVPHIDDGRISEIASAELKYSQLRPYVLDVFDESGRSILDRPAHMDPAQVGVTDALSGGVAVLHRRNLELLTAMDPRATMARVATVPMRGTDGRRYVLVFAADDTVAREQRSQVGWVLIMTGTVGTIAATLSGWIISGVAVVPLERFRQLAASLRPESLTQPIAITGSDDEVSRLAKELDDARSRIRERFEAQERFLSNVSHELKTPIGVLLTESQTLNRKGVPDHALGFIDSARDEMSRLGHLVESFLTLTRIEDGKGLARFRRCPANDLIMSSLTTNRMMAEQHRVRLVATIMSEDDMDVAIAGEPGLLGTMVDNIIRNAIRFSPENGRIHIGIEHRGGWVHITVRDEGPGIPPERLPTIFDRFAQAHDGERRGRGHGLGLAIAKGIAELHRGTITATNLPDRGCEFTISLPVSLHDVDDPPGRADDSPQEPGRAPSPSSET